MTKIQEKGLSSVSPEVVYSTIVVTILYTWRKLSHHKHSKTLCRLVPATAKRCLFCTFLSASVCCRVILLIISISLSISQLQMNLCARKQTICIGENKGADRLRSNCEADQRLCFRYTDSTNSSSF